MRETTKYVELYEHAHTRDTEKHRYEIQTQYKDHISYKTIFHVERFPCSVRSPGTVSKYSLEMSP